MKKNITWLLWLATLLFLGFGAVSAQSLPSIGSAMTSSTINQPYQQSQCVEPDGSIVYVNRQFYLWDTYTTTDVVPKWGNGYDTLLLSSSRVFVYNSALFNFTSPITWKSNGIPNNAPVNAAVTARGTFVVNSTAPAQLVYNIHRTALENAWSSSYSLTYLGRTNLVNYTAQLNNKTFHNQAWRVVDGYECVNYTVHYCWDGVKDTQQSIASLPWGFGSSIANEQCDGTDGVPNGSTCTNTCTLQTIVTPPTCVLSVSSSSVNIGTPLEVTWSVNGNYTNNPQIRSIPNTLVMSWLPYNIPGANGQRTITPQNVGTYTVTMTVSNSAGSTTCTAPVVVTQPLSCVLTLTPHITQVNQIVSVGWTVIGNFYWTYIYVTPNVVWARPHRVNANQYNGVTSMMPTQTGNYLFTMIVYNNTQTTTCTATLVVGPPPPAVATLTKTLVNNILYHSGDLVSFRIDFSNPGTVTVDNVVLTDYLPGGLDYVSSQIFGVSPYTFGTGTYGINQFVTYSWFDLAPGQAGYMDIVGRFKWYNYSNQTLNNVFLHSDNVPTLNASAMFYPYVPSGNATITKISDRPSYYIGENVVFTIAVTNNGPDTIDTVQLVDAWPTSSCLTIDPIWTSTMPMTMTNTNNPYTWNLTPSLTIGQTFYLYLTGHIANNPACAGPYTNVVNLNYMVNGTLQTGQAHADITVVASAMTIDKSISQYGNASGSPIVFELLYTNNGTTTISSYNIVDYWPGTLTFVSATPMPTTQTPTSGGYLLNWTFINPIAPGWTWLITIHGTIN